MKRLYGEVCNIIKIFFYIIKSLLTSKKIYYHIIWIYKGYGLKFASIVVLISSIITMLGLYININILEYNLNRIDENNVNYLDYIVDQFPEPINYNGHSISFPDDNNVIKIKNKDGRAIILFDVNNKSTGSQRVNVPIIFKKNEVLFPKINYLNSIIYSSISNKNYSIYNTDIKSFINYHLGKMKSNILIASPIMYLLKFIDYIIENILIITLIFFMTKIFKIQINFSTVMRGVLFVVAPSFIFASILILLAPELLFISSFMKLICLFLLSKAITKPRYS